MWPFFLDHHWADGWEALLSLRETERMPMVILAIMIARGLKSGDPRGIKGCMQLLGGNSDRRISAGRLHIWR